MMDVLKNKLFKKHACVDLQHSPENWRKETWPKVLSEAGVLLNAQCKSDTFIEFDLWV